MHVSRDPLRASDLPRGGIVTIGNFDGVHLGHRRILEAVVARAREVGRPSVAITFEPHPLAVLRPDKAPKRLQTLRQKEDLLEAIGIETLLVIPFTRDFSLTEPEEFVRDFLCERLAAGEILLGHHFAFGRGKRGDLSLLRRLGPECGFVASGIDEVVVDGEPVSSTRIREAIGQGRRRRCPGHAGPRVRDGRHRLARRARRAQDRISDHQPRPGQRASPGRRGLLHPIAIKSFGRQFDCVTNIGRRPTVYEDFATTIETYVLDFSSDVYGEKVRLAFFDRVREERTFPSMMALTEQIGRDIEATRAYFKAKT